MEPKAGDRIPGMKYDTLMPKDIKPYLGGRSWENLKVGDEIAFPELDGSTITPESLVGRRITVKTESWGGTLENEGTIESFDPSTGKHEVAFDNGDKESYDFRVQVRNPVTLCSKAKGVVLEGAEVYFDVVDIRGVCIIREL